MLPKVKRSAKTIYLDHAATTPLDPKVEAAMRPFLREQYGNPSSLHQKGREAKLAIEQSRQSIAQILNCRSNEIVFTAGGTESVNLAIFGTAKSKAHITVSAIEHEAVLKSARALKQWGWQVTALPVNKQGLVKVDDLKKSIRSDTALVSIMYANNEIGTVEPIAEIGKWLRAENNRRRAKNLAPIIFHTDACQAAGSLNLDVNRLGVDLMSINGSKIYGPKQTGLLYVRSGISLKPLIYGGGQERGLRSGTENVAGIAGLAKALELAQKNCLKENKRLIGLRNYFQKNIFKTINGVLLNGPDGDDKRLPNNLNVSFKGIDGEALMLYLDGYNIAVSTGSACTTGKTDPSHVIQAIGRTPAQVRGTIRFSLGKSTTKSDLDYVLKILPAVVKELRRLE